MSWIIGGIFTLWVIYTFNQFIKYRNLTQTAWADIEVYLSKRHQLIPNLVEVVKGYIKHEKTTLTEVVQARNSAIDARGFREQIPFENNIEKFLSHLFVLAEDYPDLKANESFHKLHIELTDVEDQIADARRYYNAVVRDNNTYCEVFPASLMASLFGFKPAPYFKAHQDSYKGIEVNINE